MPLLSYQYPMERVLYNVHHQLCTSALSRTTPRSRTLVEHALLLFSLCCFGALLLLHVSFVYHRGSNSWTRSFTNTRHNIPTHCLRSIAGFDDATDLTHVLVLPKHDDRNSVSHVISSSSSRAAWKHHNECVAGEGEDAATADIFFTYSPVQGYLRLPSSIRAQHKLTTQYVYVSRSDASCFGEAFLQALVRHSHETVVLNWLMGAYHGVGFVYNPRTDAIHDLSLPPASMLGGVGHGSNSMTRWMAGATTTTTTTSSSHSSTTTTTAQTQHIHETADATNISLSSWYRQVVGSKLSVVLKTGFLFFITTTLVSFTLRETQSRMLDFTHQLQARVRSRRPVVNLVLMHLTDTLVFCPVMVGMVFFLIEFYRGDKLLAFMVMSMVWICEVFSVISLRSAQGIHFFPRIFFLLFALFHLYAFSFPVGFTYTALASTACFLAHSMLFFWQRFELPAVALGVVSLDHPRMNVRDGASPPNLRAEESSAWNHPPPIPATLIPPRQANHGGGGRTFMARQPSRGSNSSLPGTAATAAIANGRISRQPSNSLFHPGEDGDDGSYVYFMGGEVVMHRPHERPSSVNGSLSNGSLQNGGNVIHGGSTHSDSAAGHSGSYSGGGGGGHHHNGRVHHVPEHVLAQADGSGSMDEDELETLDLPLDPIPSSEEVETSALRAILTHHRRVTPQTSNVASTAIDARDPRVARAPTFPGF